MAMVAAPPTTLLDGSLATLSPYTSPPATSSTERLWKAYFADPSQWWDNRNSKTSPRSPDFKHKITKESLWIDCTSPNWVKDLLESDSASTGMHSPKSSDMRENSRWEMLSLEEALTSLEQMPHPPSIEAFMCILRKCRTKRNVAYALRLHAFLRRSGLEAHRSLGNYLVPMLVEVGSISDAQQVFDRLVDPNEYSWTSLITGYIESGESQHAFLLYQKMRQDSVHPSGYTYVALLKACARMKDTQRGEEIHAEITRKGLLERNPFVGSTLVDMYGKCGSLAKAQEVFDKLPVQDTVSWNALMAGYAEHGLGREALNCFKQMQLEGISLDAITFVCSLKACGSIRDIAKGQEIHAQIARKGLLECNPFVGSTLVDMYAKCGSLSKAQDVFDKLPVQDAVSWTALIAGYAENGLGQEALNCFEQMQRVGLSPDAVTFVCSLKACGSIGAIDKGHEIHVEVARKGLLETDSLVGNALVDMYAKCGSLAKAREVFDKLPVRDASSWNALIAGYAEHGLGQEALNCFEQMQLHGIFPDEVTIVYGLKACGNIGAINKGQEIHAEIARNGLLESNSFIASTLVDMYAKCGLVEKAQEVFDKLRVQDAISWTSLIAGYAQHGRGQDALNCFRQMQQAGVSPDAVTFVCCLKACSSIGALVEGREMHDEIEKKGLLESDIIVGNALVDMYAKCGSLVKAREVFELLPLRNAISWNALIAGYAEHGLAQDALNSFEQMELEGISPDMVTFLCSLKACGSIGVLDRGQEIHAKIALKGLLESNPFVGSALVDMYAKCGSLAKAQDVFDKLPVRDAVSWNALIAGYADHGLGQEALNCFKQMQLEGISPDAITFVCSLKACGGIRAIDKGQELHAEIAKKGLSDRNFFVGSTLVDMYSKCGSLVKALEVFDKLPVRDAVSWTALIAGYVEHGLGHEALNCFERMQLDGVPPDAASFVCSLKACGSIGAIEKGQEIHADIAIKGLLESDPIVGNALVSMYAKCGLLAKAHEAFDKLLVRDTVSWNVLITGYVEHGFGWEALDCFEQMQVEGVSPDVATFICSLKACGSIGALDMGQEIHAEISRKKLFESDPSIGNVLVGMYAKCGSLAKAREVFDKLPIQDAVSWNALIGGHVEHGLGEEALNCCQQMQLEGVSPDDVTFVSSLKACGSTGAIDKGREIHGEVVRQGFIERNPFVGSTLIDMYAKCGSLAEAQEVFDQLPVRDVISWTALITAYAHLGESENVFHMLDRMRDEGIEPDEITFLSVLNVCSHTGLVKMGQMYFEAMRKDYGITPTIEHHTCMVDLLCRAGQLDEAVDMVKKMPFDPNPVAWHTVLGACQKSGNVELARQAFKHAVLLDERDASAYVLMSNISVNVACRSV